MSNLTKRILSALILGPVVIFLTLHGGIPFFIMICILFFLMCYELLMLTSKFKYAFIWIVFGVLYISGACVFMIFFDLDRKSFPITINHKHMIMNLPVTLLLLVGLVWINDIFSFFIGKTIGGPKLAPRISPGKTWSGTIGGILACVLFFFIMSFSTSGVNLAAFKDRYFIMALVIHTLVPILSVCGDLLESWVKRKAGVKDSGNIIPGHGGILDRVDGLLMVMNVMGVYYLILYAISNSHMVAQGMK